MTDHTVLIAGGGPTGLMLAAELAVAGVDVAIVERRANQHLDGSRAGGLHTRTLEVLDQRGVAERFIAEGTPHPVVHFHVPLEIGDAPTRHNYTLGLWQKHTERILAGEIEPDRRERADRRRSKLVKIGHHGTSSHSRTAYTGAPKLSPG